ncbi:uncharacterized protein [Thunnus thynnus]|uniref:uncharacterized protein n=1 Tax=Thunnus thynnus TaxID=8237 RepID=UPI0035295607
MLTHASLLRLVRQEDWFTSIDLKCYEYCVLPFGLSLSPRVFVRCMEAAIAPLRQQDIRLATYLDNWLLLAQSEQEAGTHTRTLIRHLSDLGFMVNAEKSMLSPAQSIIFLGLSLDSVSFTARLSVERVKTFRTCLALFCPHRSVRFRLCLRLLGLMVCHSRSLSWPPPHEGFPVLGGFPQAGSRASRHAESVGHIGVRQSAASLASLDFPDPGEAHGLRPVQESGHYRCESVGLGRNTQGPVCERTLERWSPAVSHKFSGALSGVSLSETLPPVSRRSPCLGEDGQYNNSGVYQSSRGVAFPSVTHAGTQTDPLEQRASPLPESDARSGGPEHGCGPAVQGHASIGGVDSAPGDRGTDMDALRSSCDALASRDLLVAACSALATPAAQGSAVAGRGGGVSPTPGAPRAVGLACEWLDLTTVGLPQTVIANMGATTSHSETSKQI